MLARGIIVRLGLLAAISALALLAFFSVSHTQTAEAVHVGRVCTFAPTLPELRAAGGGSGTVTCTFNVHGHIHTLVVNFTLTFGPPPPPVTLTIDGCTLDGNPFHRGPCP